MAKRFEIDPNSVLDSVFSARATATAVMGATLVAKPAVSSLVKNVTVRDRLRQGGILALNPAVGFYMRDLDRESNRDRTFAEQTARDVAMAEVGSAGSRLADKLNTESDRLVRDGVPRTRRGRISYQRFVDSLPDGMSDKQVKRALKRAQLEDMRLQAEYELEVHDRKDKPKNKRGKKPRKPRYTSPYDLDPEGWTNMQERASRKSPLKFGAEKLGKQPKSITKFIEEADGTKSAVRKAVPKVKNPKLKDVTKAASKMAGLTKRATIGLGGGATAMGVGYIADLIGTKAAITFLESDTGQDLLTGLEGVSEEEAEKYTEEYVDAILRDNPASLLGASIAAPVVATEAVMDLQQRQKEQGILRDESDVPLGLDKTEMVYKNVDEEYGAIAATAAAAPVAVVETAKEAGDVLVSAQKRGYRTLANLVGWR